MLGSRRGFWAGLLAAAIGSAVLASSAPATPSATLTVQLVPGAVSAGEPALAIATFHNLSRVTLPRARVTLNFPKALTVISAPGCGKVTATTRNVVCGFGDVPSGGSAQASVSARLAAHLEQNQSIRVTFALRVGPGTPVPILTGASAKVLASTDAANRGACRVAPTTLTARFEQQVTSLPAPPSTDPRLKLPCTPLAVGVNPPPSGGVYNTRLANVDIPKLTKPAIVKLFFPNETLPDENLITNLPPGVKPSFDNPNPLWRFDEKTGKRFVVPKCLRRQLPGGLALLHPQRLRRPQRPGARLRLRDDHPEGPGPGVRRPEVHRLAAHPARLRPARRHPPPALRRRARSPRGGVSAHRGRVLLECADAFGWELLEQLGQVDERVGVEDG